MGGIYSSAWVTKRTRRGEPYAARWGAGNLTWDASPGRICTDGPLPFGNWKRHIRDGSPKEKKRFEAGDI